MGVFWHICGDLSDPLIFEWKCRDLWKIQQSLTKYRVFDPKYTNLGSDVFKLMKIRRFPSWISVANFPKFSQICKISIFWTRKIPIPFPNFSKLIWKVQILGRENSKNERILVAEHLCVNFVSKFPERSKMSKIWSQNFKNVRIPVPKCPAQIRSQNSRKYRFLL